MLGGVLEQDGSTSSVAHSTYVIPKDLSFAIFTPVSQKKALNRKWEWHFCLFSPLSTK